MALDDAKAASKGAKLTELASFLQRGSLSIEVRVPPEGAPSDFDRGDLAEVFRHLSQYEAIPMECIRALKALASIAYSNADMAVALLPQILRVAGFHHEDKRIQALIARIFGHFAYDTEVARRSLLEPDVIEALLRIMETCPSKDASARAGEALARIIVADMKADPEEARVEGSQLECIALVVFYVLACRHQGSCPSVAKDFTAQILSNEIMDSLVIVASLLSVAKFLSDTTLGVEPSEAMQINGLMQIRWLLVIEDLIDDPVCGASILTVFMHAGIVGRLKDLMAAHVTSYAAQSAGVSILMCIANSGTSGLKLIADAGACQLVEVAMNNHPSHPPLQGQCVQFWRSCITWTKDLQVKAGFSPGRAIDLMKTAMASHIDCAELQLASLETLAYYLESLHCHRLVKVGGGEGLVKTVMTRHASDREIQTWAKCVLDAIGLNRHWTPKGSAQASEAVDSTETECSQDQEGIPA
mmetsp:Transcript_2993/g.5335  ORF Transcript_2993/g.5335 Transcript_2993/m.5335 type:complete len:472 (-) Transcript_2993:168-1583(-)